MASNQLMYKIYNWPLIPQSIYQRVLQTSAEDENHTSTLYQNRLIKINCVQYLVFNKCEIITNEVVFKSTFILLYKNASQTKQVRCSAPRLNYHKLSQRQQNTCLNCNRD